MLLFVCTMYNVDCLFKTKPSKQQQLYSRPINKKLCYREGDSASVALSWFTSLSALFSATYGLDIPDCSNWCLSRAHRSSIGHISAFWHGTSHRCLLIMPLFSVTSANIAISDTSLKTRFFGLHFRRRKYQCIFNHFYVIGPTGTKFSVEKRQSNGHYAVQGHSRSPILVPIESSYATSH